MANSPQSMQTKQRIIQDLYLQHHDWLVQWLRHRIRYPYSATDIVQDTFVKLLQAKRLLDLNEPRAYLVNIAKHVLIDQQRRYVLEQTYLEELAQQLKLEETDIEKNMLEEAIHILDVLTVALQDTSPAARQAFLLYYLEGYNQTEVAEQIGKSLRTTQSYLAECLSLCFAVKQQLIVED